MGRPLPLLSWAEAHHTLFGLWPTTRTGPIGATGETWLRVDAALRVVLRGLPGGSSLSRFLKAHGKVAGSRTPFHRAPKPRPEGL